MNITFFLPIVLQLSTGQKFSHEALFLAIYLPISGIEDFFEELPSRLAALSLSIDRLLKIPFLYYNKIR